MCEKGGSEGPPKGRQLTRLTGASVDAEVVNGSESGHAPIGRTGSGGIHAPQPACGEGKQPFAFSSAGVGTRRPGTHQRAVRKGRAFGVSGVRSASGRIAPSSAGMTEFIRGL